MRLATRCTACGTTFRVVPDQLRVSDGWVRCGRCDTVFDAWISLAEMDGEGSGATQYAGLVDRPPPPVAEAPPVEAPAEAFPAYEAPAVEALADEASADEAPAIDDASLPEPEPEPEPELAQPALSTAEPGVDIYATLLVSDDSGVPEEWLTNPPSIVDVARAESAPAEEVSDETIPDAPIPEAESADTIADEVSDVVADAVPDVEALYTPHLDVVSDTSVDAEAESSPTVEHSAEDDSGLHLLDLQEPPPAAPAPIDAHETVAPPPGFVISDYAQDPVLDVEAPATAGPATATIVDVRDDELHAIPPDAQAGPWTAAAPARAPEPIARAGETNAWADVEDANNLLPRWKIPDDPSEIVAPTTTSGALTTVPGFVLDADRRARWQHPAVRAVLALVALVLMATLVLQAAIQWRDDLVADHPDLRASLERVCQTVGCTISAPRRIDDLVVDSSGLAKLAGSGSDEAYRLSLVLRSRSPVDVAMPAFELTLSDAQGTVVARRVLQAHDLHASRATVPSGAELPMHATLTTPGHAVVGYTVEIFYP